MRVVVLGLSITSSWGNGHATNYRALVRSLTARGDDVLFLERDVPWYAASRDLPEPPWGRTRLYGSLEELEQFEDDVRDADLVVVGSYVPDGVAVGEWVTATTRGVTAFWDIDTPITVAKLERGDDEYLSRELVGRYDLYLSFTGGPILELLTAEFGARRAVPFHCVVDAEAYAPVKAAQRYLLGYLGTYSDDRQPLVEELLLEPARRLPQAAFVVGGPQYPASVVWPGNITHLEHVPPSDHPGFYAAQRFTLNVTRAEMRRWGWSPSVRLFEAAASGVAIVSDVWDGLDAFFEPGAEILVARDADEACAILTETSRSDARAIAARARARVLREHTAERRAQQLAQHVREVGGVRT